MKRGIVWGRTGRVFFCDEKKEGKVLKNQRGMCYNNMKKSKSLLTYLFAHVWLAYFPPYFARNPSETFVSLVNTQSIACGFGFILRKI